MDNSDWKPEKIVALSGSGREPVKEWLKSLTKEQRQIIGTNIKTVEFGWPVGMPLVRFMERNLSEVRSNIPEGIARVFFTLAEGKIILFTQNNKKKIGKHLKKI